MTAGTISMLLTGMAGCLNEGKPIHQPGPEELQVLHLMWFTLPFAQRRSQHSTTFMSAGGAGAHSIHKCQTKTSACPFQWICADLSRWYIPKSLPKSKRDI